MRPLPAPVRAARTVLPVFLLLFPSVLAWPGLSRAASALDPDAFSVSAAALPGEAAAPASPSFEIAVDAGKPLGPLRHIVDFFHPHDRLDTGADLRALKPRFLTSYISHIPWGRRGPRFYAPAPLPGAEPVANFHAVMDSSVTRRLMDSCRARGIRHFQAWSEPNRTWGAVYPVQDAWLTAADWPSFCRHAAQIYRHARTLHPDMIYHGPVLTTDARAGKDPDWLRHVMEFAEVFLAEGLPLHYLSVNPPFHPEDVHTLSSLAAGLSRRYPQLGLKGISLGEYPFFIDSPSRNLRFLLAFEETENLLFAARSHFRQSSSNTGLITAEGEKKPLYWMYHRYAAMTGRRLRTSTTSRDAVTALAALAPSGDSLSLLVGNDHPARSRVALRFSRLPRAFRAGGKAFLYRFEAAGPRLLQEVVFTGSGSDEGATAASAAGKSGRAAPVRIDLGEVEGEGGRGVLLVAGKSGT